MTTFEVWIVLVMVSYLSYSGEQRAKKLEQEILNLKNSIPTELKGNVTIRRWILAGKINGKPVYHCEFKKTDGKGNIVED